MAKEKRDKKMTPEAREMLRALPSVANLLEQDEVQDWLTALPRATVTQALRFALDDARRRIKAGDGTLSIEVEDLLAEAEEELVRLSMPSLRRVINATGIVLHTGLGRAPLSREAVEAIADGAAGYTNLEFDLTTGKRGRRSAHIAERLATLVGAEAATVVNNNAAATYLILRTFGAGGEVIVSRGQLVEIGGSYRLPDIMSASGATLREVGTTNRTRLSDYEKAIDESTRVLLRVHTSNYRVVGFTEEVGIGELAELAHSRDLLAVDDLGSGALFDPAVFGLPDEPCARDSIAAGADLVCFSGDKLLGGPQAGLIAGRKDLIQRLEASPLMRTYRVDKLTLLALEATLAAFSDPEHAVEHVPTLSMLSASTEDLSRRADELSERLRTTLPQERFLVCSATGFAGGGSMPQRELDSVVIQWRPARAGVNETAAALRQAETPVVAHIRDDALCFDLRTIFDEDFEALVDAVAGAVWDLDAESPSDPNDVRLPIL